MTARTAWTRRALAVATAAFGLVLLTVVLVGFRADLSLASVVLLYLLVVVTAAIVVGACSSGGGGAASGSPAPSVPTELGSTQGQSINVLAWPGYVENGSTDPAVDWVTDFQKQTGRRAEIELPVGAGPEREDAAHAAAGAHRHRARTDDQPR